MFDHIMAMALNNPVLTVGCILIVCFLLFIARILGSSNEGYDPNENNIRHWG